MTPTVERVLERIRSAGGRLTVPTRHVVSILSGTERHLTADDIIAELERVNPGVAPSTVYRVLQRLHEIGALGHVRGGNGAAFYHLREHGHAHLVCGVCGSVSDLDHDSHAALAQVVTVVHHRAGFVLDPHQTALVGTCAACATSSHHARTVTDRSASDEQSMVHRTSGPGEPSPLHDHGGSQ